MGHSMTEPLSFTYLGAADVAACALTDDEILDAITASLRAQGDGRTVIEPRVHLIPESSAHGHFNVLRGVVLHWGWRVSRSSATSSTTTHAACLLRWRC